MTRRVRLHRWVVATTIDVEPHKAEEAHVRERLTLSGKVVVDVLEVYCDHCRKPYEPELREEPCQLGPQHSGGPRKQPDLAKLEQDRAEPELEEPGQGALFEEPVCTCNSDPHRLVCDVVLGRMGT